MATTLGLSERLKSGNVTIAAEGFLLELERRGYNSNGDFVPQVVIDNPDQVEQLTREYVHAGSDISMAFTYYAHREKLRDLGREEDFTKMNNQAHEIAKRVARETGTLFCAGFGTTNIYDPKDEKTWAKTEEMFREQISLSAEHGVDFVAIETIWDYGEASIALKVANEFKLPAIVTISPLDISDGPCMTFDGLPMVEALQRLEKEGAACVGLNCCRGPETMIPVIREIRPHIKGPLACISLGYRTTAEQPNWYRLKHPGTGERSFPDDLCAHYLGMADVAQYAAQLKEIGVEYVGFCCGNSSSYTRTLAMAFGKNPPAAKYVSAYKEKSIFLNQKEENFNRYTTDLPKFNGLTLD